MVSFRRSGGRFRQGPVSSDILVDKPVRLSEHEFHRKGRADFFVNGLFQAIFYWTSQFVFRDTSFTVKGGRTCSLPV